MDEKSVACSLKSIQLWEFKNLGEETITWALIKNVKSGQTESPR